MATISSKWDGLSQHLLATFYEVKKEGGNLFRWVKNPDSNVVQAPLTDTSMQIELSWNGPFDNAGVDSKAPALMSLLQNGGIQQYSDSALGSGGINQKLNEGLSQFEGRTGVTKLNSTQVFTGMSPLKITCTAHFRAWDDAISEVERAVDQLMAWALPEKLSEDGSVVARSLDAMKGKEGSDLVNTLMPSLCPHVIGMQYKGRNFAPLVIESIDFPMDSPINSSGKYVQMAVQLTLTTLYAVDREYWTNTKTVIL